jgi:hypothetical protein
MSDYNGWTNKETWLVSIWYLDHIAEAYADSGCYYVEPDDLACKITGFSEEIEIETGSKSGLLGDFISTSWSQVNWHELADALNETLAAMEEDNDSIEF